MQITFFVLSTLVAVATAQVPVRLVGGSLPSPGQPLCMAAQGNGDGLRVSLAQCNNLGATFPAGNLTWTIPTPIGTPGQIRTFDGSGSPKCLDVTNGNDVNGNLVQVFTCFEGNTNQMWTVTNGDGSIRWFNHNKCLDVTDGVFNPGTNLQIFDCVAGNTNQLWFPSLLT